jgi:hypothetical protein
MPAAPSLPSTPEQTSGGTAAAEAPPAEVARTEAPPPLARGIDGEARAASAAANRRQRREAAPARSDGPSPPSRSSINARCSDILQKASLEPLTASEADYLRRECR